MDFTSNGIDSLLSDEQLRKANDEWDLYWIKRGAHGRRRLVNPPTPPPTPVDPELTLHFDDPLEEDDQFVAEKDGFYFNQDGPGGYFTVSKNAPQPGFINLRTYTGRTHIGFTEFSATRIARGGLPPGTYPLPGDPWDLISLDFAPGNFNGMTVRFTGRNNLGQVLYTEDVVVSADAPATIPLPFTGIHELHMGYVTTGTAHPSAVGPMHFWGGFTNLKYKLP